MNEDITILGIESSCDDTSAAVIRNGYLLSNVTASQEVHREYGGVVPELASRAHEQNILPTVYAAVERAKIRLEDISAVACTLGPGLMGSLLVGVSFAKGLCIALGRPLISVNHLQGHILAHFIQTPPNSRLTDGHKPRPYRNSEGQERETPVVEGQERETPDYPFLCLLVSGGNSQIVKVNAYNDMEIIGHTIDDAAGETIDKCSKFMGLGYPGGPIIDRLARQGNAHAFSFSKPHIQGLDYSFSGLKTSFLYFLRDRMAENPNFIEQNKNDLAASLERTVVEVLMDKLVKAVRQTGIHTVAVAGGVSANTALRQAFITRQQSGLWKAFIPPFSYTTDNAAMIAIAGYYKFLDHQFCSLSEPPFSRVSV